MAILEERMNTIKAEHESALQALRTDMKQLKADMAKRDTEMAKREADMTKREAESARRDKENFRWLIGLWIATVVLLGVLVRWPS